MTSPANPLNPSAAERAEANRWGIVSKLVDLTGDDRPCIHLGTLREAAGDDRDTTVWVRPEQYRELRLCMADDHPVELESFKWMGVQVEVHPTWREDAA